MHSLFHTFQGADHISDFAATFHYVKPDEMYTLEYFIYHLQPYGVLHGLQRVNRKHATWFRRHWLVCGISLLLSYTLTCSNILVLCTHLIFSLIMSLCRFPSHPLQVNVLNKSLVVNTSSALLSLTHGGALTCWHHSHAWNRFQLLNSTNSLNI